MELKVCEECSRKFKPPEKSKYKRKYCNKCSKKRKKDYQNIHLITVDECEEE